MSLYRSHVLFFMTLETDLAPVFEQQSGKVRLMRAVARSAITVGRRVMFVRRRLELLLEIVVTIETQLAPRLG